jgi:hypothetical protein
MQENIKSAINSVIMILMAAFVVIIGVYVATVDSPLLGLMIGIGGFITWGWACFAKNKSYA